MEELEQRLLRSADHFSGVYYEKESVQVEDHGNQLELRMGLDGFHMYFHVWSEGDLDRIIVSTGKVPELNNQSVYVETREQAILDAFLYWNDGVFYDWLCSAQEGLERRFEARMRKAKK